MDIDIEHIKFVAFGLALGIASFWALLIRWSRTDWRSSRKANRGLWIMIFLAMAVPLKNYVTTGEISPSKDIGQVTYVVISFLFGYLLGYISHRLTFKDP